MTTLLLRCVGPMQSWGTRSRFQERDTEREPSKSAVLGLLCAAMGRDRSEPLDDLSDLRMGVRIDREGNIERDYHTALDVIKASGSSPDTQTSNRYYLTDAAFLVGLEGDGQLLRHCHEKLRSPVWPLFLGRKSFVPGAPVYLDDGLKVGQGLEQALEIYPDIALPMRGDKRSERVRLLLESADGDERRQDTPQDFRHAHRHFRERRLVTLWAARTAPKEEPCI